MISIKTCNLKIIKKLAKARVNFIAYSNLIDIEIFILRTRPSNLHQNIRPLLSRHLFQLHIFQNLSYYIVFYPKYYLKQLTALFVLNPDILFTLLIKVDNKSLPKPLPW